jgi:hypothetical protein
VTTQSDERLPAEVARRSLIVFGVLLVLSGFWTSLAVTFGVFGGGALAILSYHWLHLSLLRLLAQPAPGAAKRFQFSYLSRLITLAGVLFLLIAIVRVHPVALAAGLSVVVISLLWTTIARLYASRRHDS